MPAIRIHSLLVSALLVAALVATEAAVARPLPREHTRTASPQVVLDWNATAVATTMAAGASQPTSQLYVGLVQAAVHDAVAAIEGGSEPYLIVPGVPPGASAEAAAAAAAHGALVAWFPGQKPALDDALAASLAGIADGPAEDRGVLVGQQVATGMVAARTDDGRHAPVVFSPVPAPGVWQPTPPALLPALDPWLGGVAPLALRSGSQFRPDSPPALDSRRYARDYEEVRRYGAATGSSRSAEQTETALFWTEFAPQQYNRAARALVTSRGLNLREAARALAMMDTAMADAIVACWDAKSAYAFWRPVTAIRGGDTDGNRHTVADTAWEPLRPTPNHPEYPSAHNCLAGALGEAAAQVVRSHRIDLDVSSTVTGTARHYDSVGELRRDLVGARVYAGFHWRTSGEAGFRLGQDVARFALRDHFEEE